jgi:hypothetical protein
MELRKTAHLQAEFRNIKPYNRINFLEAIATKI